MKIAIVAIVLLSTYAITYAQNCTTVVCRPHGISGTVVCTCM